MSRVEAPANPLRPVGGDMEAPPPGHYVVPVSEVQSFLNRSSSTAGQMAWRCAGWVIFALTFAELTTSATGLWPSVSSLLLLARAPAAVGTPLTYWAEYQPGAGELLALLGFVLAPVAGMLLLRRSDTSLWRTPLRAREPRPERVMALRVALGILTADLGWRLLVLSSPGAMPTAFRLAVAVAAAGVIAHAWTRLWELTRENLALHRSMIAFVLTVAVYLVATGAAAQVFGLGGHFPLADGELKVLQLMAATVNYVLIVPYLFHAAISPARSTNAAIKLGGEAHSDAIVDSEPGGMIIHSGQVAAAVRQGVSHVLELSPSNEPFTIFGPNQGADMPEVLGVIQHDAVGRLIPYAFRGGAFRMTSPDRLYLSSLTHLVVDLDAIPRIYRGRVSMRADKQRNKWLVGNLNWALELPFDALPATVTPAAWQALRQRFANRDQLVAQLQLKIMHRFEAFCDFLQPAPPEVLRGRLEVLLGLRRGTTFDPGATERPPIARLGQNDEALWAAGVPPGRLALIEECTALARLSHERIVIDEWLGEVEGAQRDVLKMLGDVGGQFATESLLSALDVRRVGSPATDFAAGPVAGLTDLLGRFNFTVLEEEDQIRLSLQGQQVLNFSSQAIAENLADTREEFRLRTSVFRQELDQSRDKDRAVQDCLLTIARLASEGFFHPENAVNALDSMGLGEYVSNMRQMLGLSPSSTV